MFFGANKVLYTTASPFFWWKGILAPANPIPFISLGHDPVHLHFSTWGSTIYELLSMIRGSSPYISRSRAAHRPMKCPSPGLQERRTGQQRVARLPRDSMTQDTQDVNEVDGNSHFPRELMPSSFYAAIGPCQWPT